MNFMCLNRTKCLWCQRVLRAHNGHTLIVFSFKQFGKFILSGMCANIFVFQYIRVIFLGSNYLGQLSIK